jgi:hypothetical protein
MTKALCRRCKGTAEGSTFEEASSKINHAAGLGRGIPCGATYGCVVDVSPKPTIPPKTPPSTQPTKATTGTVKNPKKTTLKDEIKNDIKEGAKDVVEKIIEDVEKDAEKGKSQAVNE